MVEEPLTWLLEKNTGLSILTLKEMLGLKSVQKKKELNRSVLY